LAFYLCPLSVPSFHLMLLIPASTILGSGSETNIQIVVFRVISARWLLMFRSNILLPSSGWKWKLRQCVARNVDVHVPRTQYYSSTFVNISCVIFHVILL
jgi:hypothetical protein